jgi:hypothetical protein
MQATKLRSHVASKRNHGRTARSGESVSVSRTMSGPFCTESGLGKYICRLTLLRSSVASRLLYLDCPMFTILDSPLSTCSSQLVNACDIVLGLP